MSTPFILPVLTEAEESETAYRMLENTQKPGWLAETLEGATTVWENWEGDLSRNLTPPERSASGSLIPARAYGWRGKDTLS